MNETQNSNGKAPSSSNISRLTDIQSSQLPGDKLRHFVQALECLEVAPSKPHPPQETLLRRHKINAFVNRKYVALSYTWDASDYEETSSGRYQVEFRGFGKFFPSKVRDCVFDRITAFMRHFNLTSLWIDRHCIKQRQCENDVCRHEACHEKQEAINAMDLVYKHSGHPVALLGRPINSALELKLLSKVLSGAFVTQSISTEAYYLSHDADLQEANDALRLLHQITTDLWWTRAWTFQESYRSGTKLTLLVPHASDLEPNKLACGQFKHLRGELVINAEKFSTEATRLCLALGNAQNTDESLEIKEVLNATGRYRVLLPRSDPMFPTIIKDIGMRRTRDDWDRLAIVANCCQYRIRLDARKLSQKKYSLDLAILALCLLNGEILYNGATEGPSPSPPMTIDEYWASHGFRHYLPPANDKRPHTFNKGCRFVDVELGANGVITSGHLWKLGKIIDTRQFGDKLPWVHNPRGRLSLYERQRLAQLREELLLRGHNYLAGALDVYLDLDSRGDSSANDRFWNRSFSRKYMHKMAEELVTAIEKGKALRLGRLWHPGQKRTPYRAIFIYADDWEPRKRAPETFAFTAAQPKVAGSRRHDSNDNDRHVSLEVDASHLQSGAPWLYIKRWLPGLVLFPREETRDVVFPWPPSIESIVSR